MQSQREIIVTNSFDEFLLKTIDTDRELICRDLVRNTDALMDQVYNAISKISVEQDRFLDLARLFYDNKINDQKLKKVFKSIHNDSERVKSYLSSEHDEDFCLAINNIATWSDELSKLMFQNFLPHWERNTQSICSPIDLYAFLGTYEYTPFGIHYDNEDSYLINIGPHKKNVYVWDHFDDELLKKIIDRKISTRQVMALDTPYSEYILGVGDGIYIPKGKYHVLESKQYTVMLGIAPYNINEPDFLQSLNRDFLDKYTVEKNILNEKYKGQAETLSRFLTQYQAYIGDLSNIVAAKNCYIARLKSNAYQIEPTLKKNLNVYDPEASFRLFDTNAIQIIIHDGILCMFCRGHEVSFTNVPLTVQILTSLDKQPIFDVISLHEESQVSQKVINLFLKQLFELGGIVAA